jgi:NAD(P)-dependent dehydrogenase (short-subunit alcohol dehydrogenase family)
MSRYAESHKLTNLAGAGDGRPTALQIIRDENLTGKLSDKVFLVTGVSSGIGIDTIRALHTTGAHVYGTVRNMSKGQAVVDQILAEKHDGGGKISLIEMDLSSFASVRSGAATFLSQSSQLNLLVNNAGIMACPFEKTIDGFESQFATNHLGHFLFFQLLKPTLISSASPEFPSRVVSVTSLAHFFAPPDLDDVNFEKTPYEPWTAYARSKTANIWFSNALHRRYSAQNLLSTSVHPGGIVEGSNLAIHVSEETKAAMFGDEATLRTFKSSAQGAATSVYAAVSEEWGKKGGRYLSSCTEQKSREERRGEEGMWENANEGYAEWVYDEEQEEKLWDLSVGIVGVE